jgi:hypothetical protein
LPELVVFAGELDGRLAAVEPVEDAARFDAVDVDDGARASLGEIAGALYGAPAALAATTLCPLKSPGRPVAATAGAP